MGDRKGALAAMELALGSAAGQPEPTAWSHVELAKLQPGLGGPAAARRHVLAALAALPGYPSARIELARIDAADGRLAAATREARRAVDAIPTPQAVGLLADLLQRTRHWAEARRQRATVAVIDRLLEANGVQVDVEASVFRADNRVSPSTTVEPARRAQAARPSIYGDGRPAWALRPRRRGGGVPPQPGRFASEHRIRCCTSIAATRRLRQTETRCAPGTGRPRPESCVLGSLGSSRGQLSHVPSGSPDVSSGT